MSQWNQPPARQSRRPRVAIVGGGFAGINAAMELGKMPVDVTLIDRRNHHTFQPLLYQVALAVLSPAQIAQPIRGIVNKHNNIQVLMDEVTEIDAHQRKLSLSSGAVFEYDYLILATGATHSYFGHEEWAPFAPGLKSVEDALEIRRRVLLIEGSARVLATFPEDLSAMALKQLQDLGVEVQTNKQVTEIGAGYVIAGGEHMEAVVTLWAAGVAASPLGKMLGAPTDKRGAVLVDHQLNPEGLPEVFVCGDLAHFEQDGKPVPGVAQPAMQMGRFAAKAIAADLAGKPRSNFRYWDKGDMATIGRLAAVAKIEWPFKAHWGGFMAWLTWLIIHIYFLIGFRNRITIFATWAWTYFSFKDGARLITGDQRLSGWEEATGGSAHDPVNSVPGQMPVPLPPQDSIEALAGNTGKQSS